MTEDRTKESGDYVYRWTFRARNGRVVRAKNGHPFRIPVK